MFSRDMLTQIEGTLFYYFPAYSKCPSGTLFTWFDLLLHGIICSIYVDFYAPKILKNINWKMSKNHIDMKINEFMNSFIKSCHSRLILFVDNWIFAFIILMFTLWIDMMSRIYFIENNSLSTRYFKYILTFKQIKFVASYKYKINAPFCSSHKE